MTRLRRMFARYSLCASCTALYRASQEKHMYMFLPFLPCDAMHSAAIAGMRCLSVRPSVCPSVTFVSCAKTNKDIFEIFSPCGSQAILVFPHQTGWRYSNGNSPNGGVECKGVWKNWRFSTNISLYLRNGYSEMGTCSETICKHQIFVAQCNVSVEYFVYFS